MKSDFFPLIIILTVIVGLVINGYILLIIILTKQIKSANNILLLHLSAIDILIGILFLTYFIPSTNGKEWTSSEEPCFFYGFFFTLLQPLAIWTICGLNCDRFYIIAVPLHYSRIVTSKKIWIALSTIWILSIIISAMAVFAAVPFTFIPRLGVCEPNAISTTPGFLWYSIVYVAFTLLLPAVFIIICNFKIFIIARYHRHRIASAIYQVAISAQMAITHQKNPLSFGRMATQITEPKFHKALLAMFQFVGYFILYMPYYCIILLEAILGEFKNRDTTKTVNETYLHSNIYKLSSFLAVLVIPINGFLYGLKSKALKEVLRHYLRKKQTTQDLNHEIQARTPSGGGSRRPSFLVKSENLIDVRKMLKTPFNSQSVPCGSTLQVPNNSEQGVALVTEDEIYQKLKSNNINNRYKFLHNIFDDCEPLDASLPKILLSKDSTSNAGCLDASFEEEDKYDTFKPLLDSEL